MGFGGRWSSKPEENGGGGKWYLGENLWRKRGNWVFGRDYTLRNSGELVLFWKLEIRLCMRGKEGKLE